MQVSFFSHQTVQITMPWGTVAVQKGKECHSLIEDIEIPAADSALGARFFRILEYRGFIHHLVNDLLALTFCPPCSFAGEN